MLFAITREEKNFWTVVEDGYLSREPSPGVYKLQSFSMVSQKPRTFCCRMLNSLIQAMPQLQQLGRLDPQVMAGVLQAQPQLISHMHQQAASQQLLQVCVDICLLKECISLLFAICKRGGLSPYECKAIFELKTMAVTSIWSSFSLSEPLHQ